MGFGFLWRADDFKYLDNLTNLEHLDLERCGITNECMMFIGKLYKLKYLNLSYNNNIKNLNHITSLINLKELYLKCCEGITNEELIYCTNDLQKLDVSACTINDAGMIYVGKLKQLRTLLLPSGLDLTDEGFMWLKNLDHLENLDINGINIEMGLCAIHCELKKLYLSNCHRLRDCGFETIGKMRELRELVLHNIDVGDQALKYIGELNLIKLELIMMNIGNEGLVHIGKMTSLEKLSITCCRGITLLPLSRLINLKKLDIQYCENITDEGLQFLNCDYLVNLKILCLRNVGITNEGLCCVKLNLFKLDLGVNNWLSREGVERCIKNMPNLRRINVRGCDLLNLDDLEYVQKCGIICERWGF